MKKGFTLVELMIVMVIVAILVVIALPKYQESLERARVAKGVKLLSDASDYVNSHYVMNGNTYKDIGDTIWGNIDSIKMEETAYGTEGITTVADFELSTIKKDGETVTIEIKRKSDWDYVLKAKNRDGELESIICTSQDESSTDCKNIGAVQIGSFWVLPLTY